MWFDVVLFFCRAFVFSCSQVLVGSAPLKPYGFDKGCKHTFIWKQAGGALCEKHDCWGANGLV